MEPEEQLGGEPGRPDPGRRLRRALARRLPRTRRAYNWLKIQGGYYLWRWLSKLTPRRIVATLGWLAALSRHFAAQRQDSRLAVGVEITAFWEPLTGVGWYLYRLLEAVADRDDLVVRLYGPTVVDSPDRIEPHVAIPTGAALERVLHQVPEDIFLPRGPVIRLLRRLEPLLIAADANEVVFAPNYFLPRRFRLARGARVVTIHDLGLRAVPWTLRDETLQELTGKLEHSIFEADRIITVSRAIRDELGRYGYARGGRVRPVHHGPGHLSEVAPGALPDEVPASFALHVGTLEPRKNILMLLEAWRTLRHRLPSAPDLVFCGSFGWKADAIRAEIARGESAGWVHHLGYVAEEQLAALYREAALVVFPSLYEGFGLPAVEALFAGTPLVAGDIPALREVAADAALYAPTDRPDLFAAEVERLLASEPTRAALVRAGRERLDAFSWARAAQETTEVWRAAAGRPPLDEAPERPA